MIKVEKLTKKFKETLAVDHIEFEAGKGEVFGLLGENGAGKTTTLRMLATLLQPTEGTALINDTDLVKEPEKVRSLMGVIFEGGIYDRLTARENMRYFGRLYGLSGQKLEKSIDSIIDMLDMKEYADKRAGKFSKGMKQKVAIGRSIVHDPDILLMDEPTAGLDVTSARLIHDFVGKVREQGRTVIFSSHNMVEVEKLCDRVAVIHKGKISAHGTIDELKKASKESSFEEIFVGLVGDKQ